MSVRRFIYNIVSVLLLILSIVLIICANKVDSLSLDYIIQIIVILYLAKFSYGCMMYINEQSLKQRSIAFTFFYIALELFFIVTLVYRIIILVTNI